MVRFYTFTLLLLFMACPLTQCAGALSVDNLKRIVIDASHIDQKKRGVMDMKETMLPLAKWLSRKEFKDRFTDEEEKVELMFY
jgi:protein CMS1